jgi:outer membrane protein OmpA-like peptidoglycan-associated protein
VSVPLGLGIRYMVFNDNGMITAQAGYGLGLTNNLKNNIIYSWGLYVNMSRKKKSSGKIASDITEGCCTLPSDDTDCDGVVDRLDKCPTVPGPVSSYGCPSGDRDMDGVTDENDKCPDLAGLISNQGCPIADKDGDGLSDPYDKCPEITGPPSNDGCPITDTDKDGIPDNKDLCPDQAGPISNQGCPIFDRDKDGVADQVDRCPDVYGSKINSGCPEAAGLFNSTVNLQDTVQFIIYFDFDKYNLTVTSFQILDEIKDFLRRNDNYNVNLVGHTDLEGDIPYNVRLSENRVKTTKNYLISYGIPSERISVDYKGKAKPAIPSFDKVLAWKNRRVEIFLVKK